MRLGGLSWDRTHYASNRVVKELVDRRGGSAAFARRGSQRSQMDPMSEATCETVTTIASVRLRNRLGTPHPAPPTLGVRDGS
jgi:hypothetical protein